MKKLIKCYEKFYSFFDRYQWKAALLSRIVVGWVFTEAGYGKLGNLEKVAGFFASLGFPAPYFQAALVGGVEFLCGLLLLAGLLTRLASIPLIMIMIGAILTAHRGDFSSVSDLFGLSVFLYAVILVGLLFRGPGCVSLDHLIFKAKK